MEKLPFRLTIRRSSGHPLGGLILLLLLGGCGASEPEYTHPAQAKTLLASDTTKVWKLAHRLNDGTRMNMAGCFLTHRWIFTPKGTMRDNAGEHEDCGETLHASWKFVKNDADQYFLKLSSDQFPALMNTEGDTKYFQLLALSDEKLMVRFRHAQFGGKDRTITDTYVPENKAVADRDFHW
ncbi:MAG TPA: hypothetical protein DCE41_19130 [Cytophagales bacterium]|nr:hypothetical protein [Cytophagales bacterium]HAA19677.1 hypothetical protein [Cytophagales bacterium]HAP62697.1 hypothetical protein [Cytophagales bacterium]